MPGRPRHYRGYFPTMPSLWLCCYFFAHLGCSPKAQPHSFGATTPTPWPAKKPGPTTH